MRYISIALTAGLCLLDVSHAMAAEEHSERESNPVSPARGINHPLLRDTPLNNRAARNSQLQQRSADDPFRSFDGRNNNLIQPEMGATHIQLRRVLPADYGDGIWTMAGTSRPSPRAVSNAVAAQTTLTPNPQRASDFLWQWGQFLDHDIDLTDGVDPVEPADISIPLGDEFFDPFGTGTQTMALNRSIYDKETGIDSPRQQINEITAWIDASNVYGSDETRANALRTLAGDGKLKSSAGNLLPFNTDGLANAGGDSPNLFLAGDVRANEQSGLTVMHTLFMREHNRLAEQIAQQNPELTGDEIYQKARQLVGAEMQAITYREYIPALLGENALREYQGYQDDVDASIMNSFSAAAYRYGHSALSPTMLRLDAAGNEIADGHLALRDAFFRPSRIIDEGGIAPILRGLSQQICQRVDNRLIDDVRNFLFGPPGSGGFDLAALNIQRGRDHGLPSYNEARVAMGLERAETFADVTSNRLTRNRLQSVYSSVNDIDMWIGGLSEDPVEGSHVGELFHTIMVEQFEALRDGDRYWYTLTLTDEEQELIEGLTLAQIIRRNTQIGNELQADVFHVPGNQNGGGGNGGGGNGGGGNGG
ncbi:MAG: peroxidase family protein, partial [Thiolinea sp.]